MQLRDRLCRLRQRTTVQLVATTIASSPTPDGSSVESCLSTYATVGPTGSPTPASLLSISSSTASDAAASAHPRLPVRQYMR